MLSLEARNSPSVVPTPVARVRGEPLTEVPRDLYIPPDALKVFLEAFEGPLDLLLYLIRKQNLDVLDIPMAELTRQYLGYIDAASASRLELAAEYLLMAAMLIDIKSRMLLPRPKPEEGEEAPDPRAALVERLLEYEQMKRAAATLDGLPQAGRDFLTATVFVPAAARRLPQVHPDELAAAWLAILSRASHLRHHQIGREALSVRETMSRILKTLAGRAHVPFVELFEPGASVYVLVTTFLAVLELAKETLVEVTQNAPFAPIYVRLTERHG